MKWAIFVSGSLAIILVIAGLAAGGSAQSDSERRIRQLDAAITAASTLPQQAAAPAPIIKAPDYKSDCKWIGGGIDPVLSCTSSLETNEDLTVVHCGTSSIESKCRTFRKEKEKPIEPSVTYVPTQDGGTIRVLRGGSAIR
jgi:hypothetical protein